MLKKYISLFVCISIFHGLQLKAQQNVVYSLIIGDTTMLILQGAHGNIQWQQSTDSVNWSDISGAINNPHYVIATYSSTGKRFYRAVITDSLCLPHTPFISTTISQKILNNLHEIQEGDFFGGGIVYHLSSGEILISATEDQFLLSQWGCQGTSAGPDSKSHTDGLTNTKAIVKLHDSVLVNYYVFPKQCHSLNDGTVAAKGCDTMTINEYSDWFLPAKDQLDSLYAKKTIIGGFTSDFYWSSTEESATHAWGMRFSDGLEGAPEKWYAVNTRCIRKTDTSDIPARKLTCAAEVINQPLSVSITKQPESIISCSNSLIEFSLEAKGTNPLSYQWIKDGQEIPGANDSIYSIDSLNINDEGYYWCRISNLCRTILSDSAELKVVKITVNQMKTEFICRGKSVRLNASAYSNYPALSGSVSFTWQPTAGLSDSLIYNPIAIPENTTFYIVNVMDSLGCSGHDGLTVFVQKPYEEEEICIVTVDTLTWKNKILWEKSRDKGTSDYIIYKESGVNNYIQIGNVSFEDKGEFTDIFSQPEAHGDKYKISVLDTCGNESEKSPYHKTMNLTISSFGSTMGLNWDHYVDEAGNFVPYRYYIFRGTSPSKMYLHDSVSGSFTSYNDINIFSVYYYMIAVKKPGGCSEFRSDNEGWSFSNRKDNEDLIGIKDEAKYNHKLRIFPNPFTDATTIVLDEAFAGQGYHYSVYDMQGKVLIHKGPQYDKEFSIQKGDLEKGIYFIEIDGIQRLRGKIMVMD